MICRRVAVVAFLLAAGPMAGAQVSSADVAIQGAWRPEIYQLKTGERHRVTGLIVFTATDWSVTFFVTPDGGAPRRASAEGGTYSLDGTRLVLRHLYNFSAGEELPGLPASPLRMDVRDASQAPTEPCTVAVEGDRLTLSFPSGNRMTFQRGSTN